MVRALSPLIIPVPLSPGGVDRDELNRLLTNPTPANEEAAKLLLWKLAAIVARQVKTRKGDEEDARHDVYKGMLAAIPGFNAKRGGAVDYFWTCGQRAAWYQGRKERRQPKAAVLLGVQPKATGIRNVAALDHGLRPPTDRTPLQLLDIRLKRCRKELRKLEPDSPTYLHLATGISYLQEHRRDLAGTYLPMEAGATRYLDDRIVTSAT